MAKSRRNPLLEIEDDLLSERPLASLLRRLVLLGGETGSRELTDWASRELRGYDQDEVLPRYRTLPSPIQVDAIVAGGIVRHQTVPISHFPDFIREELDEAVPLRMGIGEIEAAIKTHQATKTVQLQIPGASVLAEIIDHGTTHQHTNAVYWAVSTTALEGLTDQVRTRLAELIAELRVMTPGSATLPSATDTTNAVNLVINGRGSRVTITQAGGDIEQAEVETKREASSALRVWTVGKTIGAVAVGLATIGAFVVTWWQVTGGF